MAKCNWDHFKKARVAAVLEEAEKVSILVEVAALGAAGRHQAIRAAKPSVPSAHLMEELGALEGSEEFWGRFVGVLEQCGSEFVSLSSDASSERERKAYSQLAKRAARALERLRQTKKKIDLARCRAIRREAIAERKTHGHKKAKA